MIFNNNSEFVIPFILKDNNIFKNECTKSYIDVGVLYNYLYIDVYFKDKYDLKYINNIVKKETNLNSIIYNNNKITLKFIIDKSLDFIILPIISNGYDALTKDDLRDCALFWKEKFSKVLCNSK